MPEFHLAAECSNEELAAMQTKFVEFEALLHWAFPNCRAHTVIGGRIGSHTQPATEAPGSGTSESGEENRQLP